MRRLVTGGDVALGGSPFPPINDYAFLSACEVPALVANWIANRNNCSFDEFRVALTAAADRVGLAIAGDPTVAIHEVFGVRSDEEAALDLVGYIESDEYFSLRRRLGTAIDHP